MALTIALAGNPNSGKTTLFNLLTGMNAKIGNWPGVTIEKKTGVKLDYTDFIKERIFTFIVYHSLFLV